MVAGTGRALNFFRHSNSSCISLSSFSRSAAINARLFLLFGLASSLIVMTKGSGIVTLRLKAVLATGLLIPALGSNLCFSGGAYSSTEKLSHIVSMVDSPGEAKGSFSGSGLVSESDSLSSVLLMLVIERGSRVSKGPLTCLCGGANTRWCGDVLRSELFTSSSVPCPSVASVVLSVPLSLLSLPETV